MDFDQLTTFIEVVKLGNFSRAGQKVFRSQSAVSAQIRLLEQEYGTKLLDRTGKTVRLTPAGEVLFEYGSRLLALRNESLQAVAELDSTPRGQLTVGANEATCLYVLPDIFAEYSRLYPSVQISIYRNFSRKVLEKLTENLVDVGIVTLPVKAANLEVHSLFHDRIVLAVSPDNPLASRKSVTTEEVSKQPMIFPNTGTTRHLFDKLFRPYLSQMRVVMELSSVGMIKRFVTAGVGVSLISEYFARDEERSGELKLIPIEDAELTRELGLVYQKDRSLPRAARAFIKLVRKHKPEVKKA